MHILIKKHYSRFNNPIKIFIIKNIGEFSHPLLKVRKVVFLGPYLKRNHFCLPEGSEGSITDTLVCSIKDFTCSVRAAILAD